MGGLGGVGVHLLKYLGPRQKGPFYEWIVDIKKKYRCEESRGALNPSDIDSL